MKKWEREEIAVLRAYTNEFLHGPVKDEKNPGSPAAIYARIARAHEFIRDYYTEKERIQMKRFLKQNGFEATDDDKKRELIDALHFEIRGTYPKNDTERNKWCRASTDDYKLFYIGWRPGNKYDWFMN